jgi:REP element-mobilizing transposase RayT
MLRIGRVVAQNVRHHIVQRGQNKNTVFVENEDYSYYRNTLVEWLVK